MNGHPGGDAHTMRMIELCALSPGARVLDMGAGEGEAVALLRAHGLDAVGIDLLPCGENVVRGDMLHSGYPNESFDAIISQCAFYVSGDARPRSGKAGGFSETAAFWLCRTYFSTLPRRF